MWAGKDSNLRRRNRQIYSLLPLATRAPTPDGATISRAGRLGPEPCPERRPRCRVDSVPSFDVVSEVDMQEVKNAVDQASREAATRFDFKGTDSIDRADRPGDRPRVRDRGPPEGSQPGPRREARPAPGLTQVPRSREDRRGLQGQGPPADDHPCRDIGRARQEASTSS